ncbi:MAG TPA: helix-hairpin-helix domain-containing protein [Thermoanaerobaculia bacterium]|nr:helix-hairpin-helix domain-containing protein [Thermoanaerobaculia bacterium]
MQKSHSLIIVILLTLLTLSLCASALAADAPAAAPAGVVNINTADVTQLSYLPRVGEKVAQRIVDYRKEHGPFKKTSDLMQVKGFGEKSFERISSWLTVDGKTTLTAKVHLPRKPRSNSRPQPTN